MKKVDEIGQICSDWAHIDSGRIPASSFRLPGGFWPIFPKNREKIKFEFSEKSRFFGFSGEIPEQTAGPHLGCDECGAANLSGAVLLW